MEPWLWVALGFGVLVAAIAIEARMKRGRHRSLANAFKGEVMPPKTAKPPLGMEAIDVVSFNKTMAENGGMAYVTGRNSGKRHSHTAAHSQPPVPLPDDETYAARFQNAFGKTNKDH
jgi:hypothetical protein